MRFRCLSLALLSLLSLAILHPAHAQVAAAPPLMNFQGRLAKPDGTPVTDGTYAITFTLYDALTGGNQKWTQTINSVAVRNGVFSALLSTSTANLFNGNLWLEVKIGTNTPLAPRQQLVSVAYAMKANSVPDASIGAGQLTNDFASLARVSGGALISNGTSTALNDNSLTLRGIGDTNHGLGYFGSYGGSSLDGPALFGFGGGALGYQNTRVLTWTSQGRVGIGVSAPASTLDVNGTARMTGFALPTGAGASKVLTSDAAGAGTWQTVTSLLGNNSITNTMIQSVDYSKITNAPAISGWSLTGNAGTNPATQFIGTSDAQALAIRTNNIEKLRVLANGNVGIGTTTPTTLLQVNGEVTANVVTILGGSDVAEPYEVADAGEVKPAPGMVVAIDAEHIGRMRVAAHAYDKTVAGILSGANGIAPGLILRQKGTVADGTYPVASIGRVWCWCDADANGAIEAGDMLTTSDTPGHAMKVSDYNRANGSVIGKAMSPLKSGKGLVLVLVSLK